MDGVVHDDHVLATVGLDQHFDALLGYLAGNEGVWCGQEWVSGLVLTAVDDVSELQWT